MSAFRVGQKVVCVDDRPELYTNLPFTWVDDGFCIKVNEIYTVRELTEVVGVACVKLRELEDRSVHDNGYAASRFRPVHTLESDIAIFKAIPIPSEFEPS